MFRSAVHEIPCFDYPPYFLNLFINISSLPHVISFKFMLTFGVHSYLLNQSSFFLVLFGWKGQRSLKAPSCPPSGGALIKGYTLGRTQKTWTIRLQQGQEPFRIFNLTLPQSSVFPTLGHYDHSLLFLYMLFPTELLPPCRISAVTKHLGLATSPNDYDSHPWQFFSSCSQW